MRYELAIVGAGPAGMQAALTAARYGIETVLIDAAPRPGGQYYRTPPPEWGEGAGNSHTLGNDIVKGLEGPPVTLLCDVSIWGAFPGEDQQGFSLHGVRGQEETLRIDADRLILAPGAYDRPVPFPGWTLPGVMTAGAVQAFLKGQRVLPGRRFLLAGSGPLQLAVAAGIVEAGGEVVALLEANGRVGSYLRHAPKLWGQWPRLREGRDYARTLAAARTRVRLGWGIVAARGGEHVEEAVIARLDRAWRPVAGTEQTVKADTVAIGYGLLPRTELARLLGCEHVFDPLRGGYTPFRDRMLETSVRGVFAAGDAAGIGGAEFAEVEGRLAGAAVAHSLDKIGPSVMEVAFYRDEPALKRQRRFAALLGALFTPGPGLYTLAHDDTLICRCEEVTLGTIRRAVAEGATAANEIKGLTRAGMGNCQGRMCGELVARIIAAETVGNPCDVAAIEQAGAFTVRPPLQPLPLQVLAQQELLT